MGVRGKVEKEGKEEGVWRAVVREAETHRDNLRLQIQPDCEKGV